MDSARIALDVMGGDHAPQALIEGALAAIERFDEVRPERLVLVGDAERVQACLAEVGAPPGFEVQHASQVIEMGESPSAALRGKPDSSIAGCVRALKEGRASAMVSVGNTGAVVAASTVGLGTLEGVRRPGIAVTFDIAEKPLTMLDMGANTAPKAAHLCHYGVMGSVFMQECLGLPEPRVALLNIGEERGKGTGLFKEAHELLEAAPVRFTGNIEGNEVFQGKADVVVTDGFTGNVVLKLLEGFSAFMLELVLRELRGHRVEWAPEVLATLHRKIDYAETGGALLLGARGNVVIGHGRSDARAVANAIGLAARATDKDVNDHIVKGVAKQLADA